MLYSYGVLKCKLQWIHLKSIFKSINFLTNKLLYYFLFHCHVIACVKFAFSLIFSPMFRHVRIAQHRRRVLWHIDASEGSQGSLTGKQWSTDPGQQAIWFKRGYVMLEEPYLNGSTRLVSYLHSQSNISNPAVLLQFTHCSSCDRQDQSWEDPRFTTSLK